MTERFFELGMSRVGNGYGQRVAEHGRRFLKADAVLGQVRFRLVLVPFKIQRHELLLLVFIVAGMGKSFFIGMIV